MRTECAWCGTSLKDDDAAAENAPISHGICSLCALKLTEEMQRSPKVLLDIVQEPVFLIDSEGRVQGANAPARVMVDKSGDDIFGQLGGDVFECEYSTTGDGCGKTVHCVTCSIRNAVMYTLATGASHDHAPAFQSIRTSEGVKLIRFLISTEKSGNQILLRIDEASPVELD